MRHIGSGHRNIQPKLTMLAAIVGAGLLGSYFLTASFAFTNNNPYGGIDSCALVSGTTILYGWVNDPNAPQGSQPYATIRAGTSSVTVATNVAGYRDTAINNWIKAHYPDQPLTGTYGFKAQFSGLYKGNSYAVSGTGLNYGSGANAALTVNTVTPTYDGATHNIFSGGVIPTACLADKPLPAPLPQPAPTPAPAPAPAPAPKPSPKPTPKPTPTPTIAAPSNAADASIAVGTIAATAKIPAGNATKIHLIYGTGADQLINTTDDQAVSGSDVSVLLTALQPKTKYFYQIVRTNSAGTVANSASANFTTSGYGIVLHFTNSNNDPVSNIKGLINDAKNTSSTSDKNGDLRFMDLDAGDYTVTYTYKNKDFTDELNTNSLGNANPSVAGAPQVLTLHNTVNVDTLAVNTVPGQVGGSATHSSLPAVLTASVTSLASVSAIVWFLLRRRRRLNTRPAYNLPPGTLNLLDQLPAQSYGLTAQSPTHPETPHAGESLRDMVIKSMHEEAQKRKQEPPKDPSA